jgi:hypothetical protein
MAIINAPKVTRLSNPRRESVWLYVALALLAVDLVFVSLSVTRELWLSAGHPAGFLQSISWRLDTDHGFSEIFQYLKAALVTVLLVSSFFALKAKTYIAWSFAFLYIIFDDAYHVHESFGKLVLETSTLPPIFGVEGFFYADVLAWAVVGLSLTLVLGFLYLQEPETRKFTRRMAYLFALLFVFAGIVDGIHGAVFVSGLLLPSADVAIVAFEDGGEMIVLTAITAYVLHHYMRIRNSRGSQR